MKSRTHRKKTKNGKKTTPSTSSSRVEKLHYEVKVVTPKFVKTHKVIPIETYTHSAQRLRILFVIDQFNVGGTETYILTHARELLKQGHHVVLAGKSGKMSDGFSALGCPVYPIDFNIHNAPEESQRKELMTKLKMIMTLDNIQLVHCHQVPSGDVAIEAACAMRVPVIFTIHGTYLDPGFAKKSLSKCTAVVCVSPSVKKYLPKMTVPVHVIANGIDTDEYDRMPALFTDDLRRQLGMPEDAKVIVYAGRLAWEKAELCEKVIATCRHLKESGLPQLQLVIVGGGTQYERMRTSAEQANQAAEEDYIHLLGELTNLRSIYSLADCVIGTGRVALEAMACKSSVIALGSKGYLGMIKEDNFDHAWRSWFGDHEPLADWSEDTLSKEIQQVLALTEEARQENGWIGRRFVQEKFDIKNITEKLLDLYWSVRKSKTELHGELT